MVAVVGIHAAIGGVWAQHSQVNISFGQPAIDMALDFSSVESNTSEQPQSEQPQSEQPIQSSSHQVVAPEPAPLSASVPKPAPVAEPKTEEDLKSQPKPESKLQAKPESHVKKQTKKTVPKNDTNKAFAQKTEAPQIKTSTGTQQQTSNSAPVPTQFMSISQLTIDGNPPAPHYPKQARLNGEEGLVVVRISIDRWGRVEKSQVFQSSGFELLDYAALDATTNIRFKPYQTNTWVHRVMVDIPFNFILSP